jgi:antitoxin HicB
MARLDQPLAWPVSLEPAEEGGFVVNFPDFPEGWSQGETREEALLQAADLLETIVANYMAEGWDLPDPSPDAAGRPVVALAPLVAAKAELYRAMSLRRATAYASALSSAFASFRSAESKPSVNQP